MKTKSKKIIERNAKILEDYKSGMTRSELAEKYRLKCSYINVILHKNGGSDWNKKRKDARNKQIMEDYDSGMLRSELAEKYSLSLQTINGMLYRAGYRGDGRGYEKVKEETKEKHEKIIADYKSGMTFPELMTKYNLFQSTILQILKGAGLYSPRQNVLTRNKQIMEDYESGMLRSEIAKKYGLKIDAVHQMLYRTGYRRDDRALKKKRGKKKE